MINAMRPCVKKASDLLDKSAIFASQIAIFEIGMRVA